jgi:hypothetical protein
MAAGGGWGIEITYPSTRTVPILSLIPVTEAFFRQGERNFTHQGNRTNVTTVHSAKKQMVTQNNFVFH